MIDCGSFEYAHARLHARHGERPDEAAWRRIETLREFAALLDVARTTGLRPWLVGIGADSTAQQVEAILRGHWRARVGKVAAWLPAEWQAPVTWCCVLPDLALLQHLARGGDPTAWMRDDSTWRELCAAPPQGREAALRAGPFAALALAWPAPQTMAQVWRREWQRRLPHVPGDTGSGDTIGQSRGGDRDDTLGQLVRVLLEHDKVFAEAPPGQGWLLRSALRTKLSLLLRRAALAPAAAFIHLTLCALELERLRAELLASLLFRRGAHAGSA